VEEKEFKSHQMSCMEQIQAGLLTELQPAQKTEQLYMEEKKRQQGDVEERQMEELTHDRLVERKVSHLLPPKVDEHAMEATTTFHFPDQYYNYKGQPWTVPPAGTAKSDKDEAQSFVPKKCLYQPSCTLRRSILCQSAQEYNHHLAPVNTITFLDPPDSTIKMI